MGGSRRDQVSKTFQRDGVAVLDEALDGVAEREEFSHESNLVLFSVR